MLIIGGMVLIKGGMKSRCSWDSVLTLRSDEKLSGGFLRFCTLYQVRVHLQLKVNKYAIHAYTHGPVTGSGPSVVYSLLS